MIAFPASPFAVDLKALASFRIAVALLLLYDLFDRSRDLRALYSNEGVLPATSPLVAFSETWRPSLHLALGAPVFQFLLFSAAALAAVGLLIGYKTRWTNLASWILLTSLQNRNWYVLQAGDIWLRLLLFWSLFLPLGDRLSLDGRKSPDSHEAVASFGSAGLLIQTFSVYFFSGLFKRSEPAWRDGTALSRFLDLSGFATPIGEWIARHDFATKILTHCTLWFELAGPFFLFTPLRVPVAVLFVLFQAGMGLGLKLHLFPWIGAAAMIPFLVRPKRSAVRGGLSQAVAALALAFVVGWNLFSLRREPPPRNPLWALGQVTGLTQAWPMFSSFPARDSWQIFPAHLEDGRLIDAFRESPRLLWQKPRFLWKQYPGPRWFHYLNHLESRPELRPDLARYLCRRWNERHPEGPLLQDILLLHLSQEAGSDRVTTTTLGSYACRTHSQAPGMTREK